MGPCDWDGIRRIKAELTIPVIANGGIGRMSDVARCLEVGGGGGAGGGSLCTGT